MKNYSLSKKAREIAGLSFEGTINDLVNEIEELEEANAKLESELDDAKSEIDYIKEELEKSEEHVSELQKGL